jgi:hypothetical protein
LGAVVHTNSNSNSLTVSSTSTIHVFAEKASAVKVDSEFWTEFFTSYSLTDFKDMLFSGEVIRLRSQQVNWPSCNVNNIVLLIVEADSTCIYSYVSGKQGLFVCLGFIVLSG